MTSRRHDLYKFYSGSHAGVQAVITVNWDVITGQNEGERELISG